MGYGKSPSRFSDPRRRIDANRFGVLYLGDSLKVCFLETVLRDRREGILDDLPIEEVELTQRRYAEITTTVDLRLVDLRGDNTVRMGVPTDVVRAQRQNLARRWSQAFHEHPSEPDGIIYPSRLSYPYRLAKMAVAPESSTKPEQRVRPVWGRERTVRFGQRFAVSCRS
ncbi:RES family NAD+ phosphorylase [Mesorhizobium sp. M0220]|uniref:RES family NAD+ phosphorylase n=1 Tax=Mesorhizobium sp. M0220 TaxID=2956920 RepID=UPI00333993FA